MAGEIKTGLFLGDCLEGMKSIPDESVHLICTDPPYGVGYVTNRRKTVEVPGGVMDALENTKDVVRPVANDAVWNPDWFKVVVEECCRVLHDDTHFYSFVSDVLLSEHVRIIKDCFQLKNILVWDKGTHTAGDLEGSYSKRTEFIIFAHKGRRLLKNGRPENLIQINKVAPDRLLHNCEKPLLLMSMLIESSTDPGEIVCDPFVGSGTTLLAARGLGRQYLGWEVDPKNYEIAEKRLYEDSIQMKLFT